MKKTAPSVADGLVNRQFTASGADPAVADKRHQASGRGRPLRRPFRPRRPVQIAALPAHAGGLSAGQVGGAQPMEASDSATKRGRASSPRYTTRC